MWSAAHRVVTPSENGTEAAVFAPTFRSSGYASRYTRASHGRSVSRLTRVESTS